MAFQIFPLPLITFKNFMTNGSPPSTCHKTVWRCKPVYDNFPILFR